jgi:hypothetical protein
VKFWAFDPPFLGGRKDSIKIEILQHEMEWGNGIFVMGLCAKRMYHRKNQCNFLVSR